MPPQGTGSFETRVLADGTRAFHLRVRVDGKREPLVLHERPGCVCGCGGGWDESGARTELGNILARIRAGVWERPEPPATRASVGSHTTAPPYAEYARWWLDAKVEGVLGERPISENTAVDYDWRLGYSRSFFADTPIDEIDRRLCLDFKAHLLAEAQQQREALKAGADLRNRHGQRVVPLSLASIKKIIDTFASVLDEAIEDEYRETNPARSRRMRIKAPKPKRTFLEMDELAALLDAARDQDSPLRDLAGLDLEAGSTVSQVARRAATGERPAQIAEALSLSKSTISYHLKRLDVDPGRGYVCRRAVCEILGRAGLRRTELCDLRIGRVRLHDRDGARLRIVDAKTEAGERIVELTPDLAEVVVEHIDRLRRGGMPTGPDDYLVPNTRGGRISPKRIGEIVAAASELASERLTSKGLPPLPHTTPHTLRRTYISIALLANNFDVKWVMDQVGHADSTMTMDVYAQLQQRADRSHGTSFDRLVRKARGQLAGLPTAA